MTAYPEWNDEAAQAEISRHAGEPGPLLVILHALQSRFGYVDRQAVPAIARTLNLSRAEVHGVLTFYHDFRERPPGTHVVRICRAEACQSTGCNALADHVRRSLKIDFGGTTADGRVTLEAVYCLGNCALSPSVTIDGALHGRVDPARFDVLLAEAGSGTRS